MSTGAAHGPVGAEGKIGMCASTEQLRPDRYTFYGVQGSESPLCEYKAFAKYTPCSPDIECMIVYEPCGLQTSEVAKLGPNEQRFYVNHFGAIERRICKMHPHTMCECCATMQVHSDGFPNPFHLDCVVGLVHSEDDPRNVLRNFCFTHLTQTCFAAVNYVRPVKPQPAATPPCKPTLTKSTYAMLMASIPRNIQLFDDEITIRNTDIPGMKNFLFAMDHYGKECDTTIQHYCKDVWRNFGNFQENFDELLAVILRTIVPAFEDCILIHRILLALWTKFSRSGTQCHITNCMCVMNSDSDSEDD